MVLRANRCISLRYVAGIRSDVCASVERHGDTVYIEQGVSLAKQNAQPLTDLLLITSRRVSRTASLSLRGLK